MSKIHSHDSVDAQVCYTSVLKVECHCSHAYAMRYINTERDKQTNGDIDKVKIMHCAFLTRTVHTGNYLEKVSTTATTFRHKKH